MRKDQLISLTKCIIATIAFIFALYLVIDGQKNIGPQGLTQMLFGITILLVELYLYNRKFK